MPQRGAAVPGLRPEKAMRLHKDLGISSLDELEAAAKDDRIKKAKGLGAALQTKILQNLAIARSGAGRLHMHRAAALLERAAASLHAANPKLKRITVAGDFRRGCELVADMSIVAEGPGSGSPNGEVEGGPEVSIVDRKHFGAALLFATGSEAHLSGLRSLAASKGMRLDEDGLHKGRSVIAAGEEDIYRALGLPFVEPELREGRGEIERALKGKLPKLVSDDDLRGILHCHTNASDGTETLATMAKATCDRGFEYFGVADHSKSAHYADGLTWSRLRDSTARLTGSTRSSGRTFAS
jgi:DNA polymerase (family 10)